MPQSKHEIKRAIEGKKNHPTEMHMKDLYKQGETYQLGQMFLKNRTTKPYGKNSYCETSICGKHAQYSHKLLKENELKHKLYSRATVQALRHEADDLEKKPKNEKTIDDLWKQWNWQTKPHESLAKTDPEKYYSTVNWWAFAKKNGIPESQATAKMNKENGK